jgi:DNA-binding HxlR family transcriptional regulator
MKERGKLPALCERFHKASELIGRRWTGAILFVLMQECRRFAELRAAIPAITDRMLSERLRELEHEGLVGRTVLPEPPVRVEYALTAKGRALGEVVNAITTWAHDWLPDPARGPGTAGPRSRTTAGARPAARKAAAAVRR